MDFASQAAAASSQFFRSLAPGSRIVIVASLVALVAAAALFWRRDGGAPDAYLMGGYSFSAAQLRDMEAAFGKAELADYEFEGDRVRVPRGQQSKYMAALADAGALPDDFGDHLRRAVHSSGFMLSGSRQEAQTKIALESELQLAISRMKGVKRAWVHIAEETAAGFPKQKTVTASVGIEPRGEAAIDDATFAMIRSFVANAWGGLKPENVTIAKFETEPSATAASPTPPPAPSLSPPEQPLAWITRNWPALGVCGVLVVGFVVLSSAFRSPARPPAGPAPAISLPNPQSLVDEAAAPAEPIELVPLRQHGPSAALRRELHVMVREHPQAAVGVLRSWLSNAS